MQNCVGTIMRMIRLVIIRAPSEIAMGVIQMTMPWYIDLPGNVANRQQRQKFGYFRCVRENFIFQLMKVVCSDDKYIRLIATKIMQQELFPYGQRTYTGHALLSAQ